jgi:hypothetical protein
MIDMKRLFSMSLLLISGTMMIAQSEFDAAKLMQHDINGTARYMGMAGAMGALGGDASSIKDNPAGLGVYRKSELTGTYNYMTQSSATTWNNNPDNSGGLSKATMNNFTFVAASKSNNISGLVSSNWAFSFNRLRNFNREVSMSYKDRTSPSSITDYMAYFSNGKTYDDLDYIENSYDPYFDNTNVPWISILAFDSYLINPTSDPRSWTSLLGDNQLVKPSYYVREKGYLDEYSLSWAGNIDNVLQLGLSGNLMSLSHTKYSSYSEILSDSLNLDMNLENTTITTGAGFNLNFGAIYRPADYVRVGLSVRTPTLYALEREHFTTLKSHLLSLTTNKVEEFVNATPTEDANGDYVNVFNFKMNDPLKINASVAFVLGKFGLISVEYNYNNYRALTLMNNDNSLSAYRYENEGVKTNLNSVGTIKVGGELRLSDNFSLRGGFASSAASTKSSAVKEMPSNTVEVNPENFLHHYTNYFSGGLGYRNSGFFADLAFVRKVMSETFIPYGTYTESGASVLTNSDNIVVTVGFRF